MKTKYFEKVENKYVFNFTLIFWHIFVAISTLAIVVSLGVLLWSAIPASEKKVEKQPYPEKKQYPAPVKVTLADLKLEDVKKEEAPPVSQKEVQIQAPVKQTPLEDTKGKDGYETSLNTLKTLIPPDKYSWNGSGAWSYPYGERYWTFYKLEKYRQWVSTEPGIEDKLKYAFALANAGHYIDKKQILDAYISVVRILPEEKRLNTLQILMSNVANNVSQNINTCTALTNIVSKMKNEENISYLNQLASFGRQNAKDGPSFINYISTIIDKFDVEQRVSIIDHLVYNGFYGYFYQNFSILKEATDLFLPLVSQVKAELQPKALIQYYGLYLEKNRDRNNIIAQIENEHQQEISQIDQKFILDQANALMEYQKKQKDKEELRQKSLEGIGAGVVLIVLIASALVFLSIQRSVKKIEEKLSAQNISNP